MDLQFRAKLLIEQVDKLRSEEAKNKEYIRLFEKQNIDINAKIEEHLSEIESLRATA